MTDRGLSCFFLIFLIKQFSLQFNEKNNVNKSFIFALNSIFKSVDTYENNEDIVLLSNNTYFFYLYQIKNKINI